MPSPEYKRCLGCGDILDGLPEPRCPECGRGFDADDRSTYGPSLTRGAGCRRAADWGFFSLLGGVFLSLFAGPSGAFHDAAWGFAPVVMIVLLLGGGLLTETAMLVKCGWRLLSATDSPSSIDDHRHAFAISLIVLVATAVFAYFLWP